MKWVAVFLHGMGGGLYMGVGYLCTKHGIFGPETGSCIKVHNDSNGLSYGIGGG